MTKQFFSALAIAIPVLLTNTVRVFAQDPIEHVWYDAEKTGKIQIFKATDGKFYGKLVWLKEPNRDGKPKTDIKNPDAARRNDPILGLQLLKGFSKEDEHHYEGGTVYDPKSGKTYSCKMTLNNKTLEVRGYVGLSMFGRTTTWTIAE